MAKNKLPIHLCPNMVVKVPAVPGEKGKPETPAVMGTCGRSRDKIRGGLSWVCPGCDGVQMSASSVEPINKPPMNAVERWAEKQKQMA